MPFNVIIFYNELRKHLQLALSYRLNFVVTSLSAAIIFTAVMFLVGRGSIQDANLSEAFIGYVIWLYATVIITQMSRSVTEEAQTGTLEQMFMSPASPTLLLIARAVGGMLLSSIFTMPFLFVIPLVLDFSVPATWQVILPIVPTLLGLMGFGLALSGVTLLYKRTAALTVLIQNSLLFLSGALIPITQFPAWLSNLSSALPITLGIEATRDVGIRGNSLGEIWFNGDLPLLLAQSFAYAILGALLLRYSVGVARRRGTISAY